jgi:hypothetical protein
VDLAVVAEEVPHEAVRLLVDDDPGDLAVAQAEDLREEAEDDFLDRTSTSRDLSTRQS